MEPNLELIITIVSLSILTACLAMTYQIFMLPNMIFYPVAVGLGHLANINQMWNHISRPLGRCRYCNAIWIGSFAFSYKFGHTIFLLLFFGMIPIFVFLLSKYVFPKVDPNKKVDKKYGFSYTSRTPWPDMLKSYVIIGSFYLVIFGVTNFI